MHEIISENGRFSTFKSYLGILTLSECHEILDGGRTWCKEATVQILSKSDKVKSLPVHEIISENGISFLTLY